MRNRHAGPRGIQMPCAERLILLITVALPLLLSCVTLSVSKKKNRGRGDLLSRVGKWKKYIFLGAQFYQSHHSKKRAWNPTAGLFALTAGCWRCPKIRA